LGKIYLNNFFSEVGVIRFLELEISDEKEKTSLTQLGNSLVRTS
jgi:hypothetical protein